jgi:spoIIIJ-associated protein
MEWVETTGRTVEDAKDSALDQLGVDENDAEFVIVSEPKAGLFGRVRGEARVRARVRPTSPRPKRARPRRQGEQREGSGGRSSAPRGNARAKGAKKTGSVAVAGTTTTVAPADQESENGSQPVGGGAGTGGGTGRRRSRSRGRSSGSGTGEGTAEGAVATAGTGETAGPDGRARAAGTGSGRRARSTDTTKEAVVGETMSLEEQGASAREFVAGLVDELGLRADVTTRIVDEDTAEVAVDGDELGILIGPGGATLAALQELARTFVQKSTAGHSSRIMVDVAGYRAKRAAALQRFSRQVAEEVLASGSERGLEPMSASDRKVVHDTINEIEGLSTRSEGEEPRRHIVIVPDVAASPASADDD